MVVLLDKKNRKALKKHRCDYCGGIIKIGEIYSWSKLKYDDFYEFKGHLKCESVANDLWEFIDPDEGMSEIDFQEGCQEFCTSFVCCNCEHFERESSDCAIDEVFCIDRIYEYLKTHELYRDQQIPYVWKCRKSTDKESELRSEE